MKKSILFAAALTLGCVALPHRSPAPLVIKPGESATYVPPGGEVIPDQKDAQTQFDKALEAENKGKIVVAINGYRKTVHRFPKSTVAAAAQYKIGVLLEQRKDAAGASVEYEKLILNYPHSTDFNAALEGEFRIGTEFLDGLKQKVFGVATLPSRTKAVACFTVIVRNAPFSRWAPMAQFNIGEAFQMEADRKSAIAAYQIVVDKYPTDPIAADAMYQIGYSWMLTSQKGSNDRTSAQRARESFEDFLAAYPNNERAPQAKENLQALGNEQSGGSLKIADYYFKQRQYRAAVVYYNDVIRQQPNSPDGEKAKSKLDQIRTKFGEKYFTDAPGSNVGAKTAGLYPKVGDGRLQAQTDTAHRPDYVGPPVSAPTPAPTPKPANNPGGPPADNLNLPGQSAPQSSPPPPPPEGEQPALPSQ